MAEDGTGGEGGEGEGGGESWTAGLPEDMRGNEALGKFADVGALAKGYLEMETYRGPSVALPGEGASDADWDAFHGRMGRPESAEAYGMPSKLPDGFKFNDDELKGAQTLFHKAGLTDRQGQAMLYHSAVVASEEEAAGKKAHDEGIAKLKETWGDKFEAHTEVAKRAGKALGLPDDQARALENAIGDSHLAWQALHAIGVKLGEDRLIRGDTDVLKTDKAEAQRKIDAINADPKHPYNATEPSPEHTRAVEEVDKLYKIVHGTEEVITTIAA